MENAGKTSNFRNPERVRNAFWHWGEVHLLPSEDVFHDLRTAFYPCTISLTKHGLWYPSCGLVASSYGAEQVFNQVIVSAGLGLPFLRIPPESTCASISPWITQRTKPIKFYLERKLTLSHFQEMPDTGGPAGIWTQDLRLRRPAS